MPTPAEQLAGPAGRAGGDVLGTASPPGRTRRWARCSGSPTRCRSICGRRSPGSCAARVVGAQWWDRARGAEQVPRAGRAARGGRGRSVSARRRSRSCRTASSRTSRPGCSTPYLDACGCPTGNRGLSFVDPLALQRARDRAGRGRLPGALPRDRRPRGPRGARRRRARRGGQRAATDGRHHLAHLQVVVAATTSRASPAFGASATIQPLWAAHEPQMDDLTIPFLGEDRAALQYPFGDLRGRGRAPRRRQRLAGQQPGPAARRTRRGQPRAARRTGRPRPSRSTRATASTWPRACGAYTAGSAYVNHLDDDNRAAGGRAARGPRRARPRPVRRRRRTRSPRRGSSATYVEGESVFRAGSG